MPKIGKLKYDGNYLKVASSDTSLLEAHAGFFGLLMKGIFYPYVPFDKKLISYLVTRFRTRDYTVHNKLKNETT